VTVELVHLASLYHDDVMDEATMRRKVESVNARWGNLVAIVAGDYLLARSAEIAASLGAEIASLLARTLAALCQGQVAEVQAAFRTDRSEDHYLETIAGKTAALMATSCRIGGLTAGLPGGEVEALTAFGERFGMLFQLRDDVLDVMADAETLGKPPGQDLAEGVYTLPTLRALADPHVGQELGRLLGRPLDVAQRETARRLVAHSPALRETVAVGQRFADEAAEATGALADRALGRALQGLTDDLLRGMEEASACPLAPLPQAGEAAS
jgi:heptaprenyl diphosphate synthase